MEKNRISMEHQKRIERMALENKLQVAAEMRDENIKKKLDRLKEHVSVYHINNFNRPFHWARCDFDKLNWIHFISFHFQFRNKNIQSLEFPLIGSHFDASHSDIS